MTRTRKRLSKQLKKCKHYKTLNKFGNKTHVNSLTRKISKSSKCSHAAPSDHPKSVTQSPLPL